MFKKLLNFKKKQPTSNIEREILNTIELSRKNPIKTYVLVEFTKKDQKIVYVPKELKGLTIQIKDVIYYVNKTMIEEFVYTKGKETHKIPKVKVYEGVTMAYTPFENMDNLQFSEEVQKAIYLAIEQGILENKRKKKQDLRKIITIGLITFAAIFIFGKMFFGG